MRGMSPKCRASSLERLTLLRRVHAHDFGRVDFPDDVGELGPGRQPLGVPVRAVPPGDRGVVAVRLEESLARARDRVVRVLVHGRLGAREVRELGIQEAGEQAHESALGLALLAEEEHVVPGENRVDDLGDHRIVVADDAGEEIVAALQGRDQILTDLGFDGARTPSRGAELGDGCGSFGRGHGRGHR